MDTKKKFTQLFNYPMILLAIVSLFRVQAIISGIISVFNTLIRNPAGILSAILQFVLTVTPVILFVILWLHRNRGWDKAKKGIAIATAVLAIINLNRAIMFARSLPNIKFDVLILITILPVKIEELSHVILYTILAINLFFEHKNKKKLYTVYCIVAILCISQRLFFEIPASLKECGNIWGTGVSFLMNLALWYVPKAFENTEKAEISKGKIKAVIAIAAVVLFFYIAGGVGSGKFSSGNYYDKYDGVFDKDPNKWTDDEKQYVDDLFEFIDKQDK